MGDSGKCAGEDGAANKGPVKYVQGGSTGGASVWE